MDARHSRLAILAAILLVSMGASYRTKNFVVTAPSSQLAGEIGQAAEKYRKELAISWLGKAMPNWSSPCIMNVKVGEKSGRRWSDHIHVRPRGGLRLANGDPRLAPPSARLGFAARNHAYDNGHPLPPPVAEMGR